MCWLLSITAAMGKHGIFVKYKSAIHNVAINSEHEMNKMAMLSLGIAGGPMTTITQ